MADAPTIRYSGQGSRRQAAELGQTIADATSSALAGRAESVQIDTLRVQVPSGASRHDIEHAIRRAIARRTMGGRE
jgi:hypothetical protein